MIINKKNVYRWAILILSFGLLAFTILPESEDDAPVTQEAVVDGNNHFAFDLYQEVYKDGESMFLSPYSISTALAMTYAGSGRETTDAMQKVLYFAENNPEFYEAFGQVQKAIQTMNEQEGIQTNVANRLWAGKGVFRDEYLATMNQYYEAALEEIDLGAADAYKIINKWVEEQTNDKIKNLLGAQDLENAIAVLTNAIYFNANWAIEFDKQNTMDFAFQQADGTTKNVPFMRQTEWESTANAKASYRYMEDEKAQVLELPYAGNQASMLVILPKDYKGLDDVVTGLSTEQYNKWIDGLEVPTMPLNILMTKWKNESQFGLGDALSKMGMSIAFSGGADFSKMSNRDLFISKVIHKSFIDVSEKGTEAAAATAVVMAEDCMVSRSIQFVTDHPFLYIIKDNTTESILFMGQVTSF